jgi:hypothetical protein
MQYTYRSIEIIYLSGIDNMCVCVCALQCEVAIWRRITCLRLRSWGWGWEVGVRG